MTQLSVLETTGGMVATTKVLIVGDTHSDYQFVVNIHDEASRLGVNTIVQLGDFGFSFLPPILDAIREWLDEDPMRMWYWLDGNHDQHDYIQSAIIGDRPTDAPIPHFHDRMLYCPRGSTATIGSKTCMFLGGAFSVDKSRRVRFVSWWPQEKISHADVQQAIKNGPPGTIDVLFSHDCPETEYISQQLDAYGYKVDADSFDNRDKLTSVVDAVQPKDLYHGHYHWRYDTEYTSPSGAITAVHGVGANIKEGGWGIDHRAFYGRNFLVENW